MSQLYVSEVKENKAERVFLDWWIPNANQIISDAKHGNEMFTARRIARTAWKAALKAEYDRSVWPILDN